MSHTTKEIQDSINNVIKYIKKNNKRPATIKVGSKTYTLAQYLNSALFLDARKRIKQFRNTKNIWPNYVTIKGIKVDKSIYKILWNIQNKVDNNLTDNTVTPTPVNKTVFNNKSFSTDEYRQTTNYYCACNCLQLAFYKLTNIYVNESVIAGWAGTTTAGTGHSGIETAVKKFNSKYKKGLKITWKNFSDLTLKQQGEYLASKSSFLFYHLLYRNKYGHYETLKQINTNSNNLLVYNSLSGGYIETRSKATQKQYINGISQKSICIISK